MHKRRLLILSHVLPFPRDCGQQQRLFYTVQAAREVFHITFVTLASKDASQLAELASLCDDVVALSARSATPTLSRLWHGAAGAGYIAATGLKRSNYVLGEVEFHPRRIAHLLEGRHFDCVLFEYWHAAAAAAVFRERGIPSILDMHDVLWHSYARQLEAMRRTPRWWKRWALGSYRRREEAAWCGFDALVAINRAEEQYVRTRVSPSIKVFHAPMGTDLRLWPYSPERQQPPRLAFYGALGGRPNQDGALRCATNIMPAVWRVLPQAELWLIGSNPSDSLRRLTVDPRIKVPGYVDDVRPMLRSASAVLCPWVGTWGFRSRLVEVMALGVPVVATSDAVSGMELTDGEGLLLGRDDAELARQALKLLTNDAFWNAQSRHARSSVEQRLGLDGTYGRWMAEVDEWLATRATARRSLPQSEWPIERAAAGAS